MSITPLGNRLLIKSKAVEEKTAGGIFIPQVAQEKTQNSIVVALGNGLDSPLTVGQEIIVDRYCGTPIKINDEDHRIISVDDVLAIVD